jgi:hypothetical protein
MIDLVRDVLDKRLLDRDKHPFGRVDAIAMEIREGERPRLVYVELGLVPLCNRLGRGGRWLAHRVRRVGHADPANAPQPYRVAWSKIREITSTEVVADVDAESTRAYAWERWLSAHVISRIPGA